MSDKLKILPTKDMATAIQEAKYLIELERSGKITGLKTRWSKVNYAAMKYFRFGKVVMLAGSSGCHTKGTKVIMFDGTFKNVEDIVVGDLLMGIDSKPRRVLNLLKGNGKIYKINQNKGLPYYVNEEHILSLKQRSHISSKSGKELNEIDKIVNISVKEYLTKNKGFIPYHKGWKVEGIDFDKKEIPIDAYFLGLWLGDGASDGRPLITTMDKEIVDYIYKAAEFLNYHVTVHTKKNNKASSYYIGDIKGKVNRITELLRELNLINNKHIPPKYLYNDKKTRLELLAGIIDTDGSYSKDKKCFEISSINKELAENITYLSRSLGFYTSLSVKKTSIKSIGYIGEAYRICIYGNNLSIIPTKLPRKKGEDSNKVINPLVTGISIEEQGIDDYYGFSLSGDCLYLLEDFTVTHNSGKSAILNMIEDDFTNPVINPSFLFKHNDLTNTFDVNNPFPQVHILAFKYEMSAADEILRTLSGRVGKSYSYLLSSEDTGAVIPNQTKIEPIYNKISDEEFIKYEEILDKLTNRPISYIENAGNLEQLWNTCVEFKKK